jgi:hypothetical protein
LGVELLQQRNSLFRRPPTSPRPTVDARKPAVCFCRTKQASIAVSAVGILAKLTRTTRRHRTGLQRQARCFPQQIGSSRSVHCRRTMHNARRDLDRAEIAGAVRPIRSRDRRGFLSGVLARNLAQQPFEYFDHEGAPVIALATMHGIRKYVCHLSFNSCPPTCGKSCALPSTVTVPQADSRRRPRISIAMGASQPVAVSQIGWPLAPIACGGVGARHQGHGQVLRWVRAFTTRTCWAGVWPEFCIPGHCILGVPGRPQRDIGLSNRSCPLLNLSEGGRFLTAVRGRKGIRTAREGCYTPFIAI